MGKIGLIIQREYTTRVKKKSFIIMTFLGPLLMVGLICGAVLLGLSENGDHEVLVVDKTPAKIFEGRFKNLEGVKFHYSNKDMSNKEFEKSPYSLLLFLNDKTVEMDAGELFYKDDVGMITQSKIQHEIEGILEAYKLKIKNISKEEYESINTEFNLVAKDINRGTDDSYRQKVAMVGFGFAIVIYFFIFIYGIQVMRGVMEEKTNRIVEVLVSSVKPFELMMGKIIGIGLVALTQFLLWVVLTTTLSTFMTSVVLKDDVAGKNVSEQQMTPEVQKTLKAKVGQQSDFLNELIELKERINLPVMLSMFAFYFIGGFLVYASLFAAIGAAVDSDTDAQQFMLPITIPLIFGFIVAEMSMINPGGSAAMWFSIFPLTSPVVMMVRVAQGIAETNLMELIASMGILVVFFILCVWLAAKIYRTGILMYGKKVNYKELWKWLRYNG